MTDQPPPGSPPPPPGGGHLPQHGGYLPPGAGSGPSQELYTPWLNRVVAWVIDIIPVLLIQGIAWGILLGTQETVCVTDTSEFDLGEFCATGASTPGQLAVTAAGIVILAYVIWNFGYRQGTTGSSIGKSIVKFQVISEKTWQPIGFGLSIVRQVAHLLDAVICYIGFLWPLWDAKRQTIADKVMTTVCIPLAEDEHKENR
ncbi:MAG: RDD family protein [Mycobacterium sp.]